MWKWDAVEPFGNNPANENPSGLGTFQMNLRHPGQYYDQEVNTFYNYHRDYDPVTGRYRQADPIGLEGGLNTYGYAGAQPLRFVDPEGLNFAAEMAPGGDVPGDFPPRPLSDAAKANVCFLLRACRYDTKCAYWAANFYRKDDSGRGDGRNNWHNPELRQSENFLLTAAYPGWKSSAPAVYGWQFQKLIPGKKTTKFSMDALIAGMGGVYRQDWKPHDWQRWCDDCN